MERHYETASTDTLAKLKPNTSRDAVLLMWAISPMLPAALTLISDWGFTYKTNMVWTKPQLGLGWWVRQQHELMLIAVKGHPGTPLPANRPHSILHASRRRHSQKPDEMYDIIERMFPHLTDRLEMFARNTRPGWVSWGNEVPDAPPSE
jgi:N6-adenosine-specific RNA methylase IME4